LFSKPIEVQDEGISLTTSLHLLDFIGEGVTAVLSALHKVAVTITDRFVRATVADTTSGLLDDKIEIVNGVNTTVNKSILNPGANEKIRYSIDTAAGPPGPPGPPGPAGAIASINGDATPAQVLAAGANITITPGPAGTNTIAATGGGGGTTKQISQAANGFIVGDVIRSSGVNGEYTKSQANVATNADVVGIVSTAGNPLFTVTTEGYVTLTAGFLAGIGAVTGDDLFLSDSVAGGLTVTEPTTGSTVSKPVAQVTNASTEEIYWHNYRGQDNQSVTPSGINYTVNADETVNSYWTTVIPLPVAVGNLMGWSAVSVGHGYYGNGIIEVVAPGTTISIIPLAGESVGNYVMNFSQNKIVRIKQTIASRLTQAVCRSAVGLSTVGGTAVNFSSLTNTTESRICFAHDSTNVYAICCNGVAISSVNIGAYTDFQKYIYEIVWTPGVNVKFYINGALSATITTNIPTAATQVYQTWGLNAPSGIDTTELLQSQPVISIEI